MPLPLPCLMLVSDRALCGGSEGLVSAVEGALAGGVDAVQLREKDLPPDDLLPLARRLREITRGRALLIVNGPLEVALACGADGRHLPEGHPSVERPRPGFLLGCSVHSLAAARRAQGEGLDYLIAGPLYQTRSHPGLHPAGLGLIQEITAAVSLPVLAIGGLRAERVVEVIQAGAAGIAVISAVLAAPSPAQATRDLRRALESAWSQAHPEPSPTLPFPAMITITLNGKPHQLEGPLSISALLQSLNISPQQVAVAHNGEVVPRDRWPEILIEEGDALEIVRAVGGGSWAGV